MHYSTCSEMTGDVLEECCCWAWSTRQQRRWRSDWGRLCNMRKVPVIDPMFNLLKRCLSEHPCIMMHGCNIEAKTGYNKLATSRQWRI